MKKPVTKKKIGRPPSGNVDVHYSLSPIVVERIKANAKNEKRLPSVVADTALRIGLGIDG